MRILSGGRVVGLDRCPGFDCLEELLPAKLNVLLWFLDGAERRRQLQAKFNTVESATTAAEGGCYANGKITN